MPLKTDVVAIIVLPDVMPKVCGRCYSHCSMLIVWQMESHSGRYYDYMYWVMADVIAIVTDGIAT